MTTEAERLARSGIVEQSLKKGDKAPPFSLPNVHRKMVSSADLLAKGPLVVSFYRGGWCPYCNTHLGQIATVEPELLSMGYQVLAVSPDRPEELRKTMDKQRLNYQLLCDSDMVLSRAFGIAFRVDDLDEAIKGKESCMDSKQKGKIAKVIRPGYQYSISEGNVKVVRPAQVRLFG